MVKLKQFPSVIVHEHTTVVYCKDSQKYNDIMLELNKHNVSYSSWLLAPIHNQDCYAFILIFDSVDGLKTKGILYHP